MHAALESPGPVGGCPRVLKDKASAKKRPRHLPKKRPRQRAEAQEKAKRVQEAEEGGPAYQTGMI